MTHSHGKPVLDDLAPLGRDLRKAIPDVYKGFRELHHAAFAPGELDTKTKELIAVAIAVVAQCDGCIASHARGAVKAGATKQEAAEAIGVTFLMNGGPATIYGPRAYAAFCEFFDPWPPPATVRGDRAEATGLPAYLATATLARSATESAGPALLVVAIATLGSATTGFVRRRLADGLRCDRRPDRGCPARPDGVAASGVRRGHGR